MWNYRLTHNPEMWMRSRPVVEIVPTISSTRIIYKVNGVLQEPFTIREQKPIRLPRKPEPVFTCPTCGGKDGHVGIERQVWSGDYYETTCPVEEEERRWERSDDFMDEFRDVRALAHFPF